MDFVFIQESRIPSQSVSFLNNYFREHGFNLIIDEQPKNIEVKGRSAAMRQNHGGLAALSRGAVMQEISIPEDWIVFRSSVQFLWCSSDHGGF